MSKAGRHQHPAWSYFIRDKSVATNVKARCRGCNETIQGIIGRLEAHILVCEKLKEQNESTTSSSSQTSCLQQSSSDDNPSKKLKLVQQRISPVRTSFFFFFALFHLNILHFPAFTDEAAINKQICRFAVATNCAFTTIEHPQFRKLLDMARPGFRSAGRLEISGDVLDCVYDEVKL